MALLQNSPFGYLVQFSNLWLFWMWTWDVPLPTFILLIFLPCTSLVPVLPSWQFFRPPCLGCCSREVPRVWFWLIGTRYSPFLQALLQGQGRDCETPLTCINLQCLWLLTILWFSGTVMSLVPSSGSHRGVDTAKGANGFLTYILSSMVSHCHSIFKITPTGHDFFFLPSFPCSRVEDF